MPLLGIDIYNGTPPINWQQAAQQGVHFAVAKASQGWAGGPGGWMDWVFTDHVAGARSAGIVPGGYHWALKGNGAAQAQLFVESLQRVGGPAGLVCAIDIERTDWDQSLNVDPQTVDDFLAEWDALTGSQPILLYGASWYHDGYMQAGNAWPNRPLWWAGYNSASGAIQDIASTVTPGWMQPFGGWNSYTVRQFTSDAWAGGVNVDANICFLSPDELQALTQPTVGEFTVDPEARKAFADLTSEIRTGFNQLITVVQGGLGSDPHKNPFGIVGSRDEMSLLQKIAAKLGVK